MSENNFFKVLVLDGGGSKGVYTLGVLKELEMKLGGTLYEHFDLIYGTSTGSIIASLIALGKDVNAIEKLYMNLIPKIMGGHTKVDKSNRLKKAADIVFGNKKFDAFKTDIGIVSLNYDDQKPLIFNSSIKQAHGMKQSFIPGFGCTISDAVQSSCSAYPIFDIKKIATLNQGILNVIDGGFIANNATLFALIDSYKAFGIAEAQIKLLSVGVGKFIEKPMSWKYKLMCKMNSIKFVERLLSANTQTNDVISKLLFPNLNMVRVNETFNQPEYATNMIEMDEEKLNKLMQLGRNSFAKFEKQIELLFDL